MLALSVLLYPIYRNYISYRYRTLLIIGTIIKGGNELNTIPLAEVDFYPVIQPILEIFDAILWPAIAIVVAVGTIYCIFLGVKISKADEQNSGEKAKKNLIEAVIGFVLIFVLILALKIAVPILEDWDKTQM